jgi:hypothetical protein
MLDDFRKVKVEKTDNLVYLMSYVRRFIKEDVGDKGHA